MYEVCYKPELDRWEVLGKGGKRHYKTIALAIGFGDPMDQRYKHHSVLIGGISSKGAVDILEGFIGPWDEMVEAAINFKDRYHTTIIVTSSTPERLVERLEEQEGLCRYGFEFGKMTNRRYHKNPPNTWPYFVGYEHEATIEPIPEWIEEDIESACVEFEDQVQHEIIRIPKKKWTGLWRETRKPLEEGIKSSVLRAAIYLTGYLLDEYNHQQRRKRYVSMQTPKPVRAYGDII